MGGDLAWHAFLRFAMIPIRLPTLPGVKFPWNRLLGRPVEIR